MKEKKNMIQTEAKTNNTKKVRTRVILVLVSLVLFSIFIYISYRGTYLETIEIGENYKQVFKQNLIYNYGVMAFNFIILFIAIYFTNRGIQKGLKAFFDEEKKKMPKLPSKSVAFILAAIISIFISGYMSQQVALYMNKAWFGINDPIFNMDIGFYIFEKPFFEMLVIYFIGLIIGLTIYITVYYIIVFNAYFDGVSAETLKKSKLLKQLIRNVIFIAIGFSAFILLRTQGILSDKFLLLNDDNSTSIYGAGITDVTIKVWGYRILAIVLVVSVLIAVKAFQKKQTKKVIISIAVVPTYLVAMFVVMTGFRLIYIGNNVLDKEKKYLGYNIDHTKNAYNIKIKELEVDNSANEKLQDIQDNEDLLENITLVNEDITLKTIGVTQTNTGYYSYQNTNINQYEINGKKRAVYVSPREIVSTGNRTYNNKTYEYTHGFGAVITSASSTDATGNLEYIQKDFTSTNYPIPVEQPRIYFGQETNSTIVTNTSTKAEFDYPTTTSQNAEFTYNGKAGLKLNFIDRLILAIKEKDVNLAFSSNITEDSKILVNRNIIKRAKTIMPYLTYDSDPYLVVSDSGRLVWVLDAYTVTDKYPYSQMTTIETENSKKQINYIRNSVKVLIDAYDGTTTFYITDKSDPIVMAYHNTYPGLFAEEQIPEDITNHFVYPEFLYNIQANILERYHNVSTDVLYRSDDVWEIAKYSSISSSSKGVKQEPYYTMLKTIDSDQYELGLVQQYTQLDKQSLRAYLVGKYDSKEPQLTLYKFSADSNILGPMQLETLVEQDATISKELETLNVTGTKTIKYMIIVPIDNTVLYVEPIFQLPLNEKSVPVLKKVIVSAQNKVAIDDTLKGAIRKLLSQSAVNIEVENTDSIEDLVNAVIKANNNLSTSNDNNDWEMIGKDIKRLQELIKKLEQLKEEKDKEKAKNNAVTNDVNTLGNQISNTTEF